MFWIKRKFTSRFRYSFPYGGVVLLFAIANFLLVVPAIAQKKDTSVQGREEWYRNTLRQRELQHIKDSITLEVLGSQLQQNNTSTEQKALRKRLDSLKSKDSLANAHVVDSINQLRQATRAYAVYLYQDTLFNIYSSLGPYSAKRRSQDWNVKLGELYDQPAYISDSLRIDFHPDASLILYKGEVIGAVTAADAIWSKTDLLSLSRSYVDIINKAVALNQERNSVSRNLIRIGVSLLAIVLAYLSFFLLNKGFMFLVRKLIRNKMKSIDAIKVNNYSLFSRSHILSFLIQLLKVVRVVLIVVILYCTVTFILSRFPYTSGWAREIMDFLKHPFLKLWNAVLGYLPNLVTIVMLLIVFKIINRLLHVIAVEVEHGKFRIKGFHAEWGLVTYKLLRFILIVLAIILIFPYLPGSDSSVFKGVSVFLGVLISLGSSSAIANTIAGLVITYMRPFKIGDWIQIGDSVGHVIEKNLLVTRIRTLQNEDITLPNTTILSGKTINYSQPIRDPHCAGLVVKVDVTLDYQTDWKLVTKLLMEAAANTEGVLKDPQPFVLQQNLNDFNVAYQLNAYTVHPERMFFIHSDLLHHVMDLFNEAKVNMISPQYIHVTDNK